MRRNGLWGRFQLNAVNVVLILVVVTTVTAGTTGLLVLRLTDDWSPPSPARGLWASVLGNDAVDLRWMPSVDDRDVVFYRLLRDGVLVGMSDVPRYLDSGLASGSRHRYRVIALDAAGNPSSASTELTVVIGAARPAAGPVRREPLLATTAELDEVATRVRAGAEPQASAWEAIRAKAAEVLRSRERQLAGGHPPTVCDDDHGCQLWAERPYSSDGVYDRGRDRRDYQEAFRLSSDLVTLGVAWRITGDRRYAQTAARLAVAWMVDPATAMTPVAWNAADVPTAPASQAIDIFLTVPGILYGTSLVVDAGVFSADERAGVARWARAIAVDAFNRRHYANNFDAWRLALVAAGAAFSGDDVLLAATGREFRKVVVTQIDPDGLVPQEDTRTRSLHYSMFALHGFLQTAEIARVRGRDLYDDPAAGPRLRAAVDRMSPFLATPTAWRGWSRSTGFTEIGPIQASEELAPLELAYRHWGSQLSPSVAEALRHWGRPVFSARTTGPVTLTHGLP